MFVMSNRYALLCVEDDASETWSMANLNQLKRKKIVKEIASAVKGNKSQRNPKQVCADVKNKHVDTGDSVQNKDNIEKLKPTLADNISKVADIKEGNGNKRDSKKYTKIIGKRGESKSILPEMRTKQYAIESNFEDVEQNGKKLPPKNDKAENKFQGTKIVMAVSKNSETLHVNAASNNIGESSKQEIKANKKNKVDKMDPTNEESTFHTFMEENKFVNKMTLDEWKAQQPARNVPVFKTRQPGEGEDLSKWSKMISLKNKKTSDLDTDSENKTKNTEDNNTTTGKGGKQKLLLNVNINFTEDPRNEKMRFSRSRGQNFYEGMYIPGFRGNGRGRARGVFHHGNGIPGNRFNDSERVTATNGDCGPQKIFANSVKNDNITIAVNNEKEFPTLK